MATLKQLSDPEISYETTVKEGEWISFPLGIFLLSTPKKKVQNGFIYRDVEAYDGLIILEEDKFEYRYTISAGTLYYDAIIQILEGAGIKKYNIEKSEKTLTTALEYAPGIKKSDAISDLIAAINFTPLWVDESGYFTSMLYRSPQERSVDVEYLDDEFSIIEDGSEEELDLYGVPNSWVVTLNDPERTPLSSVLENNNPDSPTSYQARGRRIVDYREIDEIADQAALDEYTSRIAFEASQVFGKVSFSTALIPIHGYSDVIFLKKDDLGINGKYSETHWSMDLKIDGSMNHEVRQVVSIV